MTFHESKMDVSSSTPLPEFVETGSHEKGFAAHFKTKIAPLLEDVEKNRLVQYSVYKKRLILGILLGIGLVIGGIALSGLTNDNDGVFIQIAIGLCVALSIWVTTPVRRYNKDVKTKFMPVVCQFFGNMTYSTEGTSSLEKTYEGEILPSFNKSQMEDFIEGIYKDVKVSLHETVLQQKRRTKRSYALVTVFKGLILALEFPKEFQGKTLMIKDGGSIGNFFIGKEFSGLDRVELEDPEFEKMFQVFSSNQIEARFLLTTAFMERLLTLARLRSPEGTPKVQCVFDQKQLVISIPCAQNFFEPQSISKSALQMNELHLFLEQMKEIFDLVDALKLTRV